MSAWRENFRVFLREHIGFQVSDIMLERLNHFLEARCDAVGARDIGDYLRRIADSAHGEERQNLINVITVGKTSFYRHPSLVRAVVDRMIPTLDETLPEFQKICIWCAACSTGEEAYTLAMALEQSGWYQRREIDILATDINTESLEAARVGLYHFSHPGQIPCLVRNYLGAESEGFRVRRDTRDKVHFEWVNLASPDYPSVASGFHLVIAANVLMYFDRDAARRAVRRLQDTMAPDSVLFLGGTESLTGFPSNLSLACIEDCYAYLQGRWGGRMDAFLTQAQTKPSRPTAPPQTQPIQIAPPSPAEEMRGTSAATGPKVLGARAGAELDFEIDAAVRLFGRRNRQEEALQSLDTLKRQHPRHPRLCRAMAMLLFRSKWYARAYEAFLDAIDADPFAFDLHYFQGKTLLAIGQVDKAQDAFRRALFLEPDFAFARYEFGLALHRRGDHQAAVREYQRAERSAGDQRVRQRLQKQAQISGESFWIDNSYIVALCRNNRDRATEGLAPPVCEK